MSDAVKALIAWCNAQGGIDGRQVKGVYYDAKITDVNNVMTEACSQVFMLVGQGFALGGAGEQTRLACGLPSVPGILGGSDVANAPLMVTPAPQPVDYMDVEGAAALAKAFPEQVVSAGVMLPELPGHGGLHPAGRADLHVGRLEVPRLHPDLSRSAASPTSGPFLQKLKDCGAQVVFTSDAAANFENMLDAAHQLDYHPIWMATSTVYDANFANWNKSGNADQVYFGERVRAPRGHRARLRQRRLRRHRQGQRRRHVLHRPAGRLGVPAVGDRGQGLRQRPHPGLRDAAAEGHPRLDRRWPQHARRTRVATSPATAAW